MALPKIDVPTFDIMIPSLQVKKRFRPFLVKEEKILLFAKEDSEQISSAVQQIIVNCCLDDIDPSKLATFDIDYIFLKLRAQSVNNIIELKFTDNEDKNIYDFKVNLDDVEIVTDPEHTNKIKVDDKIGIIMRYPSITEISKISGDDAAAFDSIMEICMYQIYDEENVYPIAEADPSEVKAFIDSLDLKSFERIQKFFDTMPKLKYEIKYKNSLDHDRVIVLDSLQSFFTYS